MKNSLENLIQDLDSPPVSLRQSATSAEWSFVLDADRKDLTPISQLGEMIKFQSCNFKLAESFNIKHRVFVLGCD